MATEIFKSSSMYFAHILRIFPKILWIISTAIMLTIGLQACKKDDTVKKIRSSGGTLEILVITDNKTLWEGSLGDSIRNFFRQQPATFAQPEALFSLANIDVTGFGKMFQAHHNILILSVDPEKNTPLLETRKDFWAAPQRIFKISASTIDSIMAEFNKNKNTFKELFLEVEYERTDRNHMLSPEKTLIEMLGKDYFIGLNVPSGFHKAVMSNDFIWMRKETPHESFGLLVYFEPYTDTIQFSPDRILLRRNGYTSRYIPGSMDSSFMVTSVDVVEPTFSRISLNGQFAVETRGLWETAGDFMGGPFVNFTTVDTIRNRLVTVEGFVYAPNAEKSHLLLQVETICRTLTFVE